MEFFGGLSGIGIVEWIYLSLWLNSLIVRKIVSRGQLPFMKLLDRDAMAEQDISMFSFFMRIHKLIVLHFFKFLDFRFDQRIRGIRIYCFGNNLHSDLCASHAFICIISFSIRICVTCSVSTFRSWPVWGSVCTAICFAFPYLPSQNIRNLLARELLGTDFISLIHQVISNKFIGEVVSRIVVQSALVGQSIFLFWLILQNRHSSVDFLSVENIVGSFLFWSFVLNQ